MLGYKHLWRPKPSAFISSKLISKSPCWLQLKLWWSNYTLFYFDTAFHTNMDKWEWCTWSSKCHNRVQTLTNPASTFWFCFFFPAIKSQTHPAWWDQGSGRTRQTPWSPPTQTVRCTCGSSRRPESPLQQSSLRAASLGTPELESAVGWVMFIFRIIRK